MVSVSDVMVAVLLSLTPSSLKKGLFELITVVAVTPPLPVTTGFTVRAIVVVRVSVPLVPVMVTVAFPVVAVPDAVKVNALVPVVEAGLNAAVTPAGIPLALSVTLPVNPPVEVTVIVLAAVAPCTTVTLAGLAESEKFGVLLTTVREIGVVWTSVPLVPVTVTVVTPTVAVLDAVNVMVLPLSVAVTPVGGVLTLKVTVPVNPLRGVTVIVLDAAAPPWTTETLGGFADSEKSGWLVTMSVMVVLCVSPPLTPVMVTVNAPLGAVADAVKVSVLVPVVDCGLKVAVTPVGTPLALSDTLPVNPPPA